MNYIFDFDGTIADSLPAMIAVYNKIVRDGENPLTPEEINKFRSLPSRKALKSLGVRWWQIPKLVVVGMGDFHALLPGIKPCKGVPELVKALHSRGDKLYIVTSNTSDNVKLFLETHNLGSYFEDIYGGASLFNKSRYLSTLVKNNKLARKRTVYIGDETRDMKAAKLARLKTVAVTWGFNDATILKKQRPSFMVDEPAQILKIKLEKGKK